MSKMTDFGNLVLVSIFIITLLALVQLVGWTLDREAAFEQSRRAADLREYKALMDADARREENDTYLLDNHCY